MKAVFICLGAVAIVFLVLVFCVLKSAAREVPPLPEEANDDRK